MMHPDHTSAHDHVFLGSNHDAHERRTGWVLALTALTGVVGAIVIGGWSWSLMRDTATVLVDTAANPALEQDIREAIEDGDASIVDLHVWQIGPGKYGAIISLEAAAPLAPAAYSARVRMHEELAHVTVGTHRCGGKHDPALRAA